MKSCEQELACEKDDLLSQSNHVNIRHAYMSQFVSSIGFTKLTCFTTYNRTMRHACNNVCHTHQCLDLVCTSHMVQAIYQALQNSASLGSCVWINPSGTYTPVTMHALIKSVSLTMHAIWPECGWWTDWCEPKAWDLSAKSYGSLDQVNTYVSL